jgi:glycosyltransferase involved in cell wall biosynthesis
MPNQPKMLVVLPALNEERSVGIVVKEVQTAVPRCTVLVVDDGSLDGTAAQAREAGAQVVSNPFNLGVGGAMRVGFRVAQSHGYDVLVQVDADGQHDARDIPLLVGAFDDEPGPQVVIGARFAGQGDISVPRARRAAMRLLARYLSRVTRTKLTDVTSGFRAHNRAGIELFARNYPADYLSDTVESLIIVADAGGRVHQVPVTMRPRLAGTPSQSAARASLYLVRVLTVLVLSVFRRHSNSTRSIRLRTTEDL